MRIVMHRYHIRKLQKNAPKTLSVHIYDQYQFQAHLQAVGFYEGDMLSDYMLFSPICCIMGIGYHRPLCCHLEAFDQ